MPDVCRICGREEAKLSYEHVPPRAAFNDEPTTVYGLEEWLARDEDGEMPGGRVKQRGAGGRTLCVSCNNTTGSWYGHELARAARSGARVLLDAPLVEYDRLTEHRWAKVTFRQSETGPHPLRLIKQIVAMMLATSQPELGLNHPELAEFVLDRERTGLPDRFRFYLALYAGPYARTTGVAGALDFQTGRHHAFVEVAWPPYAYVMTMDSEDEPAPTTNITECVDIGYRQRADMEMDLLVGFGHTAIPVDYRTKAMLERDEASNLAGRP